MAGREWTQGLACRNYIPAPGGQEISAEYVRFTSVRPDIYPFQQPFDLIFMLGVVIGFKYELERFFYISVGRRNVLNISAVCALLHNEIC